MPEINVNSEKIYYSHHDAGSEKNLILIHGSGGDHTHWSEALRELEGVNVYGLDLPGHGRSRGEAKLNVDAYADVIEKFVSELGLKNVVPAGHSLGGAIVLTLALRNLEWLSAIILVGTGARLRVAPAILEGLKSDDPIPAINLICDWAFGLDAPAPEVQRVRDIYLYTDPLVTYSDLFACENFDIMDQLKEISLPALILSGTMDRLTPVKYGKYLAEHLNNGVHVEIEGAGHMMALEKPDEMIKAIRGFLF